jgi:Tfp pilus assembly protein PilO
VIMYFWQRQQLTIVIIAIVVTGWFLLVSYLPLRQGERMTIEAIHEQHNYSLRTGTEVSRLPQLRTRLEQLEMEFSDYEARVPLTTQLGLFLQQMAEMMNTYHLKDQLIEPDSAVTTNKLSCIPVDIKGTGKLKQIFGFFKSLEELDRAVRIERVQLSNDRELAGEVKMHIKLYIYYKPTSEQAI